MILLDRRIGSSDLYQPLRAFGLAVELTTLDVADVAWLGRGPGDEPVACGVEIKRIGDLIQSIHSGRLSGHQLPKLIRDYPHAWLLVEGRYRSGGDGLLETKQGAQWLPHGNGRRPLMYREIEGFLTTLELRAGIHLRRTWDRPETAAVLAGLYHWWTGKAYEDHRAHVALHGTIQDSQLIYKPSLRRRIAAELPGIGVEKSGAIADHFPTVRAMVEAGGEEWQTIPGIGKGLATKIVTSLNS